MNTIERVMLLIGFIFGFVLGVAFSGNSVCAAVSLPASGVMDSDSITVKNLRFENQVLWDVIGERIPCKDYPNE